MCCATCRCGVAGCPSSESAEFYASLLDGMHALAQPITVLRSHFYLVQPAGAANAAERQLLADGASAIEHLCTLFRLMQELVHVQSMAAQMAAMPLSHLLGSLVEDAEAVFAGTGLRLAVGSNLQTGSLLAEDGSAGRVTLLVDAKRTRHAIASMLHVVRECSQRNSAVRCSLSAEDGWVSLSLAPETPVEMAPEDCFDEGTRLHLALAKANILGQQTVFSLAKHPFALSIRMSVASSAA